MLACLARVAFLSLALLVAPAAAKAGDLADFNALVEAAAAHNRVAIFYLRTGNTDLAGLELDGLHAAWSKVTERFAGKRPDPFDGNAVYVTVMTDIGLRLVTADMMLNAGRADAARTALVGVRDNLYRLRRSAGIAVLADCVQDANGAMDALYAFDGKASDKSLDWSTPATAQTIAGRAAVYRHELERCDTMAADVVRKNPEFRRLIDGAKASLDLMGKAIADKDNDLLHRILIELRSFDNLLAFRYG
jgi:hypothetical protein